MVEATFSIQINILHTLPVISLNDYRTCMNKDSFKRQHKIEQVHGLMNTSVNKALLSRISRLSLIA
ncbi:MAG: hypothetical protein ACI8SJ_001970 [Shewanella sp.]